ncbi:hypothetical protein ABNF97_33235 [Plantactinospora sp. B6F1]
MAPFLARHGNVVVKSKDREVPLARQARTAPQTWGRCRSRPSVAFAVSRKVFVEVWQLAPRCVDGLAWVTAIVDRRAAERLREIDGRTKPFGVGYDKFVGRQLITALDGERLALLGPSVSPTTGGPVDSLGPVTDAVTGPSSRS